MLDTLAQRWAMLGQQTEQLWVQLEQARVEAASRGNDLEKWQMWLADLLAELKAITLYFIMNIVQFIQSNRPVGGLPETAAAQLDEFRVVQADVEQRRPQMEECIRQLTEQLANEGEKSKDDWTVAQLEKLKSDWALVQVPFFLLFPIRLLNRRNWWNARSDYVKRWKMPGNWPRECRKCKTGSRTRKTTWPWCHPYPSWCHR